MVWERGREAQAEGRGAFCFYILTRKDWNHCREWDAGSVKGSVLGSFLPPSGETSVSLWAGDPPPAPGFA